MQYGIPLLSTPPVLWQRGGRAVRQPGLQGKAFFLYEPWAFGPRTRRPAVSRQRKYPALASRTSQRKSSDLVVDTSVFIEDSAVARKHNRTDADRRSELHEVIYNIINPTACIRRYILDFFDNSLAEDDFTSSADPTRCCSFCNSALVVTSDPPPNRSLRRPAANTRKGRFLKLLTDWSIIRAAELVGASDESAFDMPADYYLQEELAIAVAHAHLDITSRDSLTDVLVGRWCFEDIFGAELLRQIQIFRDLAKSEHAEELEYRSQQRRGEGVQGSGKEVIACPQDLILPPLQVDCTSISGQATMQVGQPPETFRPQMSTIIPLPVIREGSCQSPTILQSTLDNQQRPATLHSSAERCMQCNLWRAKVDFSRICASDPPFKRCILCREPPTGNLDTQRSRGQKRKRSALLSQRTENSSNMKPISIQSRSSNDHRILQDITNQIK